MEAPRNLTHLARLPWWYSGGIGLYLGGIQGAHLLPHSTAGNIVRAALTLSFPILMWVFYTHLRLWRLLPHPAKRAVARCVRAYLVVIAAVFLATIGLELGVGWRNASVSAGVLMFLITVTFGMAFNRALAESDGGGADRAL